MYKGDSGDTGIFVKVKSIKLWPSRLEQVVLPSVFYTDKNDILEDNKVDATMADHLATRGPTHSRKTPDRHLM